MKTKTSLGKKGESLAAEYLKNQGYRILEKNFRFLRGEIDIVAEDGDILVFVEVKTRNTKTLGDPEDSVTEKKQHQIWKVAEGYLYKEKIPNKECRFDLVAVEFDGPHSTLRHIPNAF